MRVVRGKMLNRLPAVSYGAWSSTFVTTEPDLDTASQISLGGTISRSGSSSVDSTNVLASKPHSLMPAFYWSGALSNSGFGTGPCTDVTDPVQTTGVACPLFHVYIFSDEDCVNRVYTSDLVGSPAFRPALRPAARPAGEPPGAGGGVRQDPREHQGEGRGARVRRDGRTRPRRRHRCQRQQEEGSPGHRVGQRLADGALVVDRRPRRAPAEQRGQDRVPRRRDPAVRMPG